MYVSRFILSSRQNLQGRQTAEMRAVTGEPQPGNRVRVLQEARNLHVAHASNSRDCDQNLAIWDNCTPTSNATNGYYSNWHPSSPFCYFTF
jgi:hypothetical protein